MNLYRRVATFSLILGAGLTSCFGLGPENADAHTVFKKSMEKKYEGVKVSCNACHVKGKSKKQRNEDLGKLIYEEMKELKLTEGLKERKGDEKKAYQTDVMIPAFEKALKIVKEKKKDDGTTYHSLIETAQLDGLKLKPKADEEE